MKSENVEERQRKAAINQFIDPSMKQSISRVTGGFVNRLIDGASGWVVES